MNKVLEDIKSILKLRGYDFTEVSNIQYISTYLIVILKYKMTTSKIESLNKIYFIYKKNFKPDITISMTILNDLMSISTENAEWYIDEIKYTTNDILQKIYNNEL